MVAGQPAIADLAWRPRGLIDQAVLTPDPEAPDSLRADVYGEVTEILALTERVTAQQARPAGNKNGPGTGVRGAGRKSQLSVVAGAGFEPAAFRL